MKKNSLVTVLAVALVFALALSVLAAVYVSRQARMSLFSGRIEQTTTSPDDPKLILKVSGESVGQDGDVSVDDEAIFPILGSVKDSSEYGPARWSDENGLEPLSAPSFVLSAENGRVDNVYCKIVVNGNDRLAEALRFGITAKYLDENGNYTYYTGTEAVAYRGCETIPRLIKADNGTVGEDEDVEFFISAWIDSYTLAKIGEYDAEMTFSVEIIFFTLEG